MVCANKMDLVGWDKSAYQGIVDEMADAGPPARRLASCTVIPISALHGDNVVERSDAAPWYDGPTVLDALESAQAGGWASQHGLRQGNGGRLPVQWVLRQPGGGRSYAGMVNGGPFRTGDPVIVLPQGQFTTVRSIETADGPLPRAEVGLSVSVHLTDDIDISRGDLISSLEEPPTVTDNFEATVCWFHDRPLVAGDRLKLKHTTRVTPVVVERVEGIFDVNALELQDADRTGARTTSASSACAPPSPLALDTYTGRPDHRQLRPDRRRSPSPPWPPAWSGARPLLHELSPDRPGPPDTDDGLLPGLAQRDRPRLPGGGRRPGGRPQGPRASWLRRRGHGDRPRRSATAMAALSPLTIERRPYAAGDAGAYRLVVTATGHRRRSTARSSPTPKPPACGSTAPTTPTHCSFILPSVHRDGPVTLAVSTGGPSPALATWLRGRLAERAAGPGLGALAELLGRARPTAAEAGGVSTEAVDWAALLDGPLPGLVAAGRTDEAERLVEAATGLTLEA